MKDAGAQMTRRECCRAGLRLVALGGLLAAGAVLLRGRGGAAAAGGYCGDGAQCPACPWRRACPGVPRPGRGTAPGEAGQ